jgi:hypothetical protein
MPVQVKFLFPFCSVGSANQIIKSVAIYGVRFAVLTSSVFSAVSVNHKV